MFKALYSYVNNIIEKYLQIYNHILLYLQWVKKRKKLKLKQLTILFKGKIKTNGIYTNLQKQWSVITEFSEQVRLKWSFKTRDGVGLPNFIGY